MSLSLQIQNLNHHAYAIVGDDAVVDELVVLLTKKYSIKSTGNQDFILSKYANFTIDDARDLKSSHLTRPVTTLGKKIFVLQMNSISTEAQNSLLKLLEETASYAQFFIIIPSSHLLLPTVRSRLQVIGGMQRNSMVDNANGIDAANSAVLSDAIRFLKLNKSGRLDMAKDLFDKVTKEKISKQYILDLLNAIQILVYKEKRLVAGSQNLKTIEFARKYMNDRSPSLKMLLEYVAVNI